MVITTRGARVASQVLTLNYTTYRGRACIILVEWQSSKDSTKEKEKFSNLFSTRWIKFGGKITVKFNVSLGSHCRSQWVPLVHARSDGHVGKPSWLHSRQMRGDHVIYLPTIPANDALPVCRPSRSSPPPPSASAWNSWPYLNAKQYVFHVFFSNLPILRVHFEYYS